MTEYGAAFCLELCIFQLKQLEDLQETLLIAGSPDTAFLAALDYNNPDPVDETIVFNDVYFNPWGNYNPSTGTFYLVNLICCICQDCFAQSATTKPMLLLQDSTLFPTVASTSSVTCFRWLERHTLISWSMGISLVLITSMMVPTGQFSLLQEEYQNLLCHCSF